MNKLSQKSAKKLAIALGLYLTALLASNTLGLKIMPFFFHSHVTVSIFWFPIVFLMTDVVGEVYGRKVAKMFVWAGFISTALFIFISLLSQSLPWSADGEWVRSSYEQIFGVTLRIALASLAAFLIGEYQDVLTFFFWRERFGKKYFWLRSNLSNIWSQFLDSTIFMVIAFAGVYKNSVLINLILTLWLYKVVLGLAYTPLSYVGIRLLKEKK